MEFIYGFIMQSFSIAGRFWDSSQSAIALSTSNNSDLSYTVFQIIYEYVELHSFSEIKRE